MTPRVSWDRGARTGAVIGDINHDGKPEMIAGNYSGGLEYFNGNAEVSPGIIQNLLIKKPLYIFPNPVKDKAILSFNPDNRTGNLSIFTLQGNLLWSETIDLNETGKYQLDASRLPNGLYVVKVTTSGTVFTGKMAVVK
ncbi:MAG: T9SS type A sorting domain-containing protein [Chlorobi bacterium]|nr:T9SS type A sorting domain-containing protein [Chlorobiota bacterium]